MPEQLRPESSIAAKPLPSFLIPHSYEAFIPIKRQYTLNPEPQNPAILSDSGVFIDFS